MAYYESTLKKRKGQSKREYQDAKDVIFQKMTQKLKIVGATFENAMIKEGNVEEY